MDYIQEDPYNSNGGQLYNDSYNQGYNQHYIDQRSPHASHTSLQSTGSNRNRMVNQVLYTLYCPILLKAAGFIHFWSF